MRHGSCFQPPPFPRRAATAPHSAVAELGVVRRCSPLTVRTAFIALAIGAFVLRADAGDFARSSAFESVEAFVAVATAFQPATTKSDLSALFTVRDLGQPEDPKTGTPIAATSIRSSVALWSNDSHALVFVTAAPPTEATRSAVGVLFLLTHSKKSWRIADILRFASFGKESGISAELTSTAGRGLDEASIRRPVITITQSQGGGGGSHSASASYALTDSKLKLLKLE